MCVIYGSLDQATGVCPMCKVFKPSVSRCPHIRDVCRNRAQHPRHDVVFMKNAEVSTFSGCGYCKWAANNPPPRSAGYQNPGWPGCCRAPAPHEYKLIGAADWPAVSVVHRIPIPGDVKALLESITAAASAQSSPTGTVRVSSSLPSGPAMSRRSSSNVVASPTRTESVSPRSAPVAIPSKSRSRGSPKQGAAMLTSSATRNQDGDGTAASMPAKSTLEQEQPQRRPTADPSASGERRPDAVATSQEPPGRKSADWGGTLGRRSSERRPSISAAIPSMSLSKVTVDAQLQRRRASTANNGMTPLAPSASVRLVERQNSAPAGASRRGSPLEEVVDTVAKMSLSSASSSGSGSNSESTVTSDGGFTDYLSDESEAELQRQAEVKAALLAQNHQEEAEFKAARQQLANVDLRPPKSWSGVNSSTPRSEVSAANSSSYLRTSSFADTSFSTRRNSVASTAAHSRG
ncbi:hypothetical protein CERSUDRAFT_111213 [Gelatoporia subvermispora B]|uniref:Uncharacterized protein n=1 Tax=Ceriporiopsis subvermispora (strain B) TaxID=914234 RepID=M2QU91_CERS8|nr:hypothetical protein CERSUDRAFT_111213 [Gelatoporia subvermispora B]